MYTAIVWIGQYGSSSRGGFKTEIEATEWLCGLIDRGTFGSRLDLRCEIVNARGRTVYSEE